MRFSKLQATGNDYVVVDARTPLQVELSDKSQRPFTSFRVMKEGCHSEEQKRAANLAQDKPHEELWTQLAQAMCQRRFGIGADGLILVQNSNISDLKMRVFNPDGCEAEACGNGLRCFTKYVIENGMVSRANLAIETLSGTRKAKAYVLETKVSRVDVNMGLPQFKPEQIPVTLTADAITSEAMQSPVVTYQLLVGNYQLLLFLLSMGNPHAVAFTSAPVAGFPLASIGPEIERHHLFPQRTNFEIARVIDRGKIEARVWERGVGETLACGTGACAIAVAAQLTGYVDDHVDITFPGGILTVYWDRGGEALLSGPVEEIFSGEYQIQRRKTDAVG